MAARALVRTVTALTIVATAGMWTTAPSWADFERGMAALQSGRYDRAQKELQPAAEQGDARAQHLLGVLYVHGLGVAQNYQEGIKWLNAAATRGHLDAQLELARLYQSGEGVSRDYRETARWYRQAAEQGDVGAQLLIGDIYAFGRGVPQDFVQALMWYEIAGVYWGDMIAGAKAMVAERLSEAQIAEAKRLARDMLARGRR